MTERPRQGRRRLAGTLILIGLAAAALLIFFLDALIYATRPTYDVAAMLPAGPGLAPGAPVWLAGHQVGRVRSVALVTDGSRPGGTVVLTLELPRSIRRLVRTDSRVRMASARPLAPPAVDIRPGSAAAPIAGPRDTLQAAPTVDRIALGTRARDIGSAFDSLSADAAVLARRMDARSADARRLARGFDRVRAEWSTLDRRRRDGSLHLLFTDSSLQGRLERARAAITALAAGTSTATTPAPGPDGAPFTAAVARLAARFDTLASRLDTFRTASAAGLPGRLARDSALTAALHAARAQLDSLIVESRTDPLRYWF